MSFKDLEDVLSPNLDLPIKGKTYSIPSPSVKVGLRAQATVAIAAKVRAGEEISPEDVASLQLDDAAEAEFTESMLGSDIFQEMIDDDLPWEYVRHAAKTVFMWLVSDRDQAEQVWASPGNVQRPEPQDRRAPAKKTPSSTKKATSKSSSTRQTSPRTPASRGTRSSSTGR